MFSQVNKNESALEKIRGHQIEMQIHPIKMTLYQIERNRKCRWLKANRICKIYLKKKKKPTKLKTRKGGLSKN